MLPYQIELVQTSFAKVVPISAAAADLFYARLFEIAPETRLLFHSAMPDQGRKLMLTLGQLVDGLNDPETMIEAAQELAVQHVCYGVMNDHYPPVGEALIWALEHGLGEDFTPAVREAWTHVYAVLSEAMIRASDAYVAQRDASPQYA